MKTVAIITARGGSKRIPRKNIKPFLGKPIISYSIQAAIKAGCFDEVMVSTDDTEIAEIAAGYGAEIPFYRSPETSDDYATTIDVLLEVINEYRKLGKEFDYCCCIYPTAPFIDPEKLKLGLELICASGTAAAVPVVQYSFPIQRSVQIENGLIKPIQPDCLNMRSQDLNKNYHDIGQYYWFKVSEIKREIPVLGMRATAIVTKESEVQDIDTEEDWMIAEMKYKILHQI